VSAAPANTATRTVQRPPMDRKIKESELAEGQYLYAIIACPEPREFKTRGMGERGDAVHTVNYRRLAAAVSTSPIVEYDSSRRNMMAHTVVLEEIMTECDILPVRFGTVATSVDAIQNQLLVARYEEFTTLLEDMHGRVELGLKAFWHEGAAFEEVVRENEKVRKLRAALQGRSLEETYYERIELGEEVEKALNRIRARDEEAILARLKPFSHKTKTNKIISDRMVLNAAFLINRENSAAMDEAVKSLDEDFGNRLMFKYVGPVPPYNFVNIVVNWEA
jgi:hypothetical protein